MSDDVSVGAVVEHARGVLAERFGVGISAADGFLCDVAPVELPGRGACGCGRSVLHDRFDTAPAVSVHEGNRGGMSRSERSSMSETTTEQVKERVNQGAQQIQDKASEAKLRTRERVREQVDNRSTITGQQMTKTGSALRQTAQQLRGDQQEQQAKVLEAVAERTERFGRYLSETDGDKLLRDAERIARQRPWVVAGGGAVLGFLGARFTKASSSRRYEADGNGSRAAATPVGYSTAEAGGGSSGV